MFTINQGVYNPFPTYFLTLFNKIFSLWIYTTINIFKKHWFFIFFFTDIVRRIETYFYLKIKKIPLKHRRKRSSQIESTAQSKQIIVSYLDSKNVGGKFHFKWLMSTFFIMKYLLFRIKLSLLSISSYLIMLFSFQNNLNEKF